MDTELFPRNILAHLTFSYSDTQIKRALFVHEESIILPILKLHISDPSDAIT